MRTALLLPILITGAIMQAAAGQDQPPRAISMTRVEIGHPVAHFMLCDVDGDAVNDAWFVTATSPAYCVVAKGGAAGGFAPPVGLAIDAGCEGLVLQRVARGTSLLLLHQGRMAARTFSDFGPPPGAAALPAGPVPAFLGFAGDLDGDGVGDPMLPEDDGFVIAMSKAARRLPVRPPVVRERAAGLRGLVSERARFPLVSLEPLMTGAPSRPLFFAGDALLALEGSFDQGFGPGVETILKVPSSQQPATLERTEARLVDIAGDGARDLLVVRTKTQGAGLAQVKSELIFHKLRGPTPGKPAQAILLPGILSSGPDIMDVDKDGRPDLFLSVFGEDLAQQVTRRITGRVKLEYLLYRGSASGPPFHRSPDFTESDSVPEAQFTNWDLRHRLILDEDWTGDGRPDLVQVTVGASGTKVEVRAGAVKDGKAQFRKHPFAIAETDVAVKDHRAWRLSTSEPAIICRTATGALIFSIRL